MDRYEAIYKRKSVRKYSGEKLSQETIKAIYKIICGAERLYEKIDLQVHLVEEGEKVQKLMRGLVGNLGKVVAPHYMVITSEEKEGFMENAGFAVENIVLRLTGMGIGTCWLGGHVKEDVIKQALSISQNQKFIVIIAFGYPEDKNSLYRENIDGIKRKKMEDIAEGSPDDEWNKIMEAVRIAPSAANSQPWKFVFDKEYIHVFRIERGNFMMKKLLGDINRLDMGIALSHLSIAASGLSKSIKFYTDEKMKKNEQGYVTSVSF